MKFEVNSYTKSYIKKADNHLYIAPIKELETVVAHYTITFKNHEKVIAKDSVLHLIPDLSGCFVITFEPTLYIKVWGPTTKVVTVSNDLNEHDCRFFVEFLPAGLYQVMGGKMQDILDQKVSLEALCQPLYKQLEKEYLKAQSFDDIVSSTNNILKESILLHSIDFDFLMYIQNIYKQNIEEGSIELNLSSRQINRYFNQYIGMGMKKFTKIATMNHILQELEDANLLDVALSYEFFDQPHFNHVFKEICKTTPTCYIENLSDFYNEIYKF